MRPVNNLGNWGACSGEGCAFVAIIVLGAAVVTGVVSGIAAEAEQAEHERVLAQISEIMEANRKRFDEIRPLRDLAREVEDARNEILARGNAHTQFDRVGSAAPASPISSKKREKFEKELPKFQKAVGQFLANYRLEPLARHLDPVTGVAPDKPHLALQYGFIGFLSIRDRKGSTRYRLGAYVTTALVLPTRDPRNSLLPAQIVFATFPYLSNLFDLDDALGVNGDSLAYLFDEMNSSLSIDIADHYFRMLQPRIEVTRTSLPSIFQYQELDAVFGLLPPTPITPVHPAPVEATSVWIPFSTMWAKEVCSAVKMESGDNHFSWDFDEGATSPFQGREVRYDFRLFDEDLQLLEEARNLSAPEYQLKSSPEPGETHFWTVRLRADVEGRDRVSEWINCDGSWRNSVGRSNAYEIRRFHSVRW